MSVASVYDTVMIAAVDHSTGAAVFETMQLASHHVLAQRVMFNVMLIPDDEPPVAVAAVSQRFLDTEEVSTFDASGSTDNVFIDTYVVGLRRRHERQRRENDARLRPSGTVCCNAYGYRPCPKRYYGLTRNLCEHGTARRYFNQYPACARGS